VNSLGQALPHSVSTAFAVAVALGGACWPLHRQAVKVMVNELDDRGVDVELCNINEWNNGVSWDCIGLFARSVSQLQATPEHLYYSNFRIKKASVKKHQAAVLWRTPVHRPTSTPRLRLQWLRVSGSVALTDCLSLHTAFAVASAGCCGRGCVWGHT
jgi:hypothetical protein